MNKKMVRIICAILCAVMVLGLIPAVAFAAEAEEGQIQPRSITDEGDGIYSVTTVEDLKELAAGTYTDWVGIWYDSLEPLVISEDLTLPENMSFYADAGENAQVIVAEGVTFETNSYTHITNLTVNGTMVVNDELVVIDTLTINGSLINNGLLRPDSESVITGIENVTNEGGAYILWNRNFENGSGMLAFLADAAANPNNMYEIAADYNAEAFEAHITGDVTIPENVFLYGENNFTLVVDEGATLTLLGSIHLNGGALVVNGTLKNQGHIGLGWLNDGEYHYGSMAVNGTYTANGGLYISAGDRTDYSSSISGIDLSQYDVEPFEYDGVLEGWDIYPREADELEMPFEDMVSDAYYVEPVVWAVEMGITTGLNATTFGVDANCTRAQFVTFLWRAAGCPEPTSTTHNFTDVKDGEFYTKAVLWAVEEGITNGLNATTFGVNEPCSRSQVVTFLHRFAGSPEPTITSHSFEDVLDGQFYSAAILWAVENGITTGLNATTFGVNNPCTRGQVVTFLFRALV